MLSWQCRSAHGGTLKLASRGFNHTKVLDARPRIGSADGTELRNRYRFLRRRYMTWPRKYEIGVFGDVDYVACQTHWSATPSSLRNVQVVTTSVFPGILTLKDETESVRKVDRKPEATISLPQLTAMHTAELQPVVPRSYLDMYQDRARGMLDSAGNCIREVRDLQHT